MNNPNHPKNGSSTLVQPIRELSHIQSIKKLLASRPRDLWLFTLGINNGIRELAICLDSKSHTSNMPNPDKPYKSENPRPERPTPFI